MAADEGIQLTLQSRVDDIQCLNVCDLPGFVNELLLLSANFPAVDDGPATSGLQVISIPQACFPSTFDMTGL